VVALPPLPSNQPPLPRAGTIKAASKASPPKQSEPSVSLSAYLQPDEAYLEGTLLAGIVWDKKFVDVRLDIANGSIAVQNLDFLVRLDTSIAGMGQISQFPEITAFPAQTIPPAWIEGTDSQGNPISIPVTQATGMAAISPVYRVHCAEIFANTVVHFSIASVALNPPENGQIAQQLFAPRRPPRVIMVKGKYESRETIPVTIRPLDFSYEFKQQ